MEIGLVGDARLILEAVNEELGKPSENMIERPYAREIAEVRLAWLKQLEPFRSAKHSPVTVSRTLQEIRAALPRSGYLVTSSGHSQAQVLQEFPFYEPGTLVTTGGFSTMGFSLPAALGVKLARPDQPVVALVGDGDFLMTAQELATAVQYDLDVIVIVLNNQGFLSIRDLQTDVYGEARRYATEFRNKNNEALSPDFTVLARSFGIKGERVAQPGEIEPALKRAIAAKEPCLIEVIVNREHPWSGGNAAGWWDVPIPEYLTSQRKNYEKARSEENLNY